MSAALPRQTSALLIGAALLLPCLVYFGTARSIVAIWQRSETYAHGFIIVPISLWLIWQRREQWRGRAIAPYWPALAGLATCGALWLLAAFGDVQIAGQYAFAAMLPLTVLAVLGKEIGRLIAFPLLFLLLAVPFGESLIDPLVDITANLTVDALRATGIPVLREGSSFSIPSGNWSVVEACSGLRYLIASFTLGCLYAYLSYTTRWRQLLFVGLAILVPIAANGARAYMIVMIAHLSDMTLAVGIDHLIYGWLFFGLVMLLLFWCGTLWREPRATAAEVVPSAPTAAMPAVAGTAASAPPRRLAGAILAAAACLCLWPAYASIMDRAGSAASAGAQADALASFRAAAPPAAPFTDWKEDYGPACAALRRFYAGAGQGVGLTVLAYGRQSDGAKLISSGNRLLPAKQPGWTLPASAMREEIVGQGPLRLRESQLTGPRGRLLVWSWYWIAGQRTGSDYVGKLLQMKEKLLSGRDDGIVIMAFSPMEDNPDAARKALRGFLAANLPSLETTLMQSQSP
jgi:exosortase A